MRPTRFQNPSIYPLALSGLCLLALALRLWGIAFGLPNPYHPVNDALVTLCATGALYAALRVLQNGSRRDNVFAGVAVGLAFSAKYTGLASLLPVLLAHGFRPQRHTTNLLVALCGAVAAIALTFPSVWFESARLERHRRSALSRWPGRSCGHGFRRLTRPGPTIIIYRLSVRLAIP